MGKQNTFTCKLEPYEHNSYKENNLGEELRRAGESALEGNHFGVVLLSGGQGSRLGSDLPKALYELNGKKLIEHHISRIKGLMKHYKCFVTLFVMVTSFTEKDINSYFADKDFGLPIEIIKQEDRVCTDENGNPLLDEKNQVIKAPGGNGDVFKALNSKKLDRFVCLNIISVDNVLARTLDPVFIGGFVKNKLEILSKAVQKKSNENVGVFVEEDGKLKIVEYIDLPNDQLSEYGNICNHLFSPKFLNKMAEVKLKEHAVLKKIPFFKDGKWVKPIKPNGYKIETFIFDCFEFAERNGFIKVHRDNEFAPLKNGPDSKEDNPLTCEQALSRNKNLGLFQ